jgi:hypothetical protein
MAKFYKKLKIFSFSPNTRINKTNTNARENQNAILTINFLKSFQKEIIEIFHLFES